MNSIELSAAGRDGLFSAASPALANPLLSTPLLGEILPTSNRSASLLFIEANVNDYQSLMAEVNPGTEVYMLDPTQDAIGQITQTLTGRTGIASLHILSHGAAGGLALGQDWVDMNDLDRHANQLQAWAKSLTADADILLYGCEVAAGANGQAFVQALANLTSADVAASTDLTGAAALGGNWNLEVKTGQIEAALAFNPEKANYNNVLAIAGDVIINEFSQGSYITLIGAATAKEWVEILVVTDNLNLQNHQVIDGNGGLDIKLTGNGFSSLKAGTLIVLYNGGDVDPTIAPDLTYNPAIGDYSLQISSLNNTGNFAVTRTIGWSNTTGAFTNASPTDIPKLVNDSGTTIFTFPRTPTPSGSSGTTSAKATAYLGNSAADAATPTNWSPDFIAPAANPGFANGAANTTWINSLRGNNAPVLSTRGNLTLPTISESIANNNNTGLAVADLSNLITDPNTNNKGIAVTKLSGNGTWQYSSDGGTNWTNFSAVSDTSATLLSGSTTLFDASLGSTPNAQGWLQFGTAPAPLNAGVSQAAVGNITRLVSTNAVPAGYSNYHGALANLLNPIFPTLDRTNGFSLSFDVKINSESHTDANRAGFSVIVVTSDNTKAIELGFWANEIWAQNDGTAGTNLFTKGEGVTRATTTQTSYDLQIKGDTYTLLAGGTAILTGKLRNYTAFDSTGAGLPYDPYERTNFIFLGDNTSSAQANVDIARVDLKTNPKVRFVPTGAGTAAIDFRAWDGTDGRSSGATGISMATNGGATAFSTAIATAALTVTANPTLSINQVSQPEGNSGTKTYTFTVALSQASAEAITVDYTTLDGTATLADHDYEATSGTLTFAAGEQSKTITVQVNGDKAIELTETFQVKLSNANQASLRATSDTGIGSIENDDQSPWAIVKTADFDGNGQADLLWRNSNTGENRIWTMNGTTLLAEIALPAVADLNWHIVGTGDFSGDGQTDILWRDMSSGANGIWTMNGTTLADYTPVHYETDFTWQVAGTGDFNGDGQVDILWRNTVSGANGLWLMNGLAFGSYVAINYEPDLNWQIVGTGDFNGDGQVDILWRNTSTGANGVWQMNGMAVMAYTPMQVGADLNWQIVSTGDFNSDSKVDIVWHNTSTQVNAIWTMDGTLFGQYLELPFA